MRQFLALWGALWAMNLVCAATGWAKDPVPVFVSILPQQYFVEQIGGSHVSIKTMVEPGANPATYEPKPRQMAALAQTRVYLAIGVPFEKAWLPRIRAVNPGMAVVHTDEGVPKIPMADHVHPDNPADGHGGERHENPSGMMDPHIWLSPPLVKIQAGHVLKALIAADPEHQADYRARCERFLESLDELHDELKTMLADARGKAFLVFHPSWGYFADTYGLRQIPIEVEGKNPKPAQLQLLIQEARQRDIRTIFVQPQFSTKSARILANALNAAVVPADPLAPDWAANLRLVARHLHAAAR